MHYTSGAVNFCPEDQPLPAWLRKAVSDNLQSQLLSMGQDGAFLLLDRQLMQTFTAEYKAAEEKASARTKAKRKTRSHAARDAEADVAKFFGLSVDGLRQKRYPPGRRPAS